MEKNPRDEKAGQDEKQIDADPSVREETLQMKRGIFGTGMDHDDEKNRDSPYGVELRNLFSH